MVQSVSFPSRFIPARGNQLPETWRVPDNVVPDIVVGFTVGCYGLRYTTFTVQWVFSQHAVTLSIAARSCDANYCCTMSHPRRLRKSQKENKNRFGDPLIDVRSSYISILVAFGRDYIKYDS